ASEVPFGTNLDVQAIDFVLKEMFPNDADHHISSPLAIIAHDLTVKQKFKEYDQKLEALTSINVIKAIEEADPPNDREGEIRKKRKKDAGEPSSRSTKKDKGLVVPVQEDTPTYQPQDQEEYYVQKHHILGPSIVVVAKKLKELIKKDELTIPYLKGDGLEKLKKQYKKDVELKNHVYQLKEAALIEAHLSNDEGDVSKPRSFDKNMSKSTKLHNCLYNNDFYYLVNLSMGEKYATSLTKHFTTRYHIQGLEDTIPNKWSKKIYRYQFEALNSIHHWDDVRKDFFKADMGNRSSYKVYSDKRIIYVVRVVVKKKWGYGFLTSIVVKRLDKK
ncbi:hypothetical protein Tco_1269157, partial [Tanacetum coccineum]